MQSFDYISAAELEAAFVAVAQDRQVPHIVLALEVCAFIDLNLGELQEYIDHGVYDRRINLFRHFFELNGVELVDLSDVSPTLPTIH